MMKVNEINDVENVDKLKWFMDNLLKKCHL